mgnify:CR=1 FL=1
MSKLTKQQMKAHDTAIRLLNQDRISNEEKLYIFQNYRADANHITSKTGAFFTPLGLARDFRFRSRISVRRRSKLLISVPVLAFSVMRPVQITIGEK